MAVPAVPIPPNRVGRADGNLAHGAGQKEEARDDAEAEKDRRPDLVKPSVSFMVEA